MQLGCENVDVARFLVDACRHVCTCCRGGIVAHAVVGVVLDLLDGYTQGCVRLLVFEESLQTGTGLLGHVIMIPPEVFRVIGALVEDGVVSVEIG